ncbi:MAG: immunity 22 family protein [Clostridium sp.]
MQKDNYVSIWIGVSDSNNSLDNYTFNNYSLDGECEGSNFSNKFEIDFVDDDLIEKSFFSLSSDLGVVLDGFSYCEKIIEEINLKNLRLDFSINSIILVYNYLYNLEHKTSEDITFLCAVPYK